MLKTNPVFGMAGLAKFKFNQIMLPSQNCSLVAKEVWRLHPYRKGKIRKDVDEMSTQFSQ